MSSSGKASHQGGAVLSPFTGVDVDGCSAGSAVWLDIQRQFTLKVVNKKGSFPVKPTSCFLCSDGSLEPSVMRIGLKGVGGNDSFAVQPNVSMLRSDGSLEPSVRHELPRPSQSIRHSRQGVPKKKETFKVLVSASDFESERDGQTSACSNLDVGVTAERGPLFPATLPNGDSTVTISQHSKVQDHRYITELLLQLQAEPKRFGDKLSDPEVSCRERHEIAADIRTIESLGYAEQLFDNGVLQSLLVVLRSSCSCCRAVALHTLHALLRRPVSNIKEADCQMNMLMNPKGSSSRQSLKSSSTARSLDQHDEVVKQLMVIVRGDDSNDDTKREAVDVLRLFVAQTSCWSSLAKESVASTLLVLLADAHSDELLHSLVQVISMLPQKLLVSNVSEWYEAVPALTGLLATPSTELAQASLTALQHGLQLGELFCMAFVEGRGLTSLEPLLNSNETAEPALDLMCLLASHPCTHPYFLNTSSLATVVAIAESAHQRLVLLALELLTSLSRCNRDCGLEFIQHDAIPVLQGLGGRDDWLVARSATVALHALYDVTSS